MARQLFPLDRHNRNSLAVYYSVKRWKGSRPAAIAAIRQAITLDPFAADLRRNLAGLLWEEGRTEEAKREMLVVKLLVPRAKLAIVVNVNPKTR